MYKHRHLTAALLAAFAGLLTLAISLLEPAEQEHAIRAVLFLLPAYLLILLVTFLLVRGIQTEWDG